MSTVSLYQDYVLPTYARYPLTATRGEGSWLWDDQDRRYLDFCTGIAVCSIGHCAPAITRALEKQSHLLLHASNLFHMPQQAELARSIVVDHVQLPGKVFFANSGAEANDGLIKSARRFGHRRPAADGNARYEVITFQQSFHGRTLGSMAATAQAKIHEGFDPLLPGFRYCPLNDLSALSSAIQSQTVAILLEPIQGEGGVNEATPEFVRGVAALCRAHDLLLFFDEVQVGFGRCGSAMAWRALAEEIEPDGISWAKGMGGGFPIGAFWLSDRVIDAEGTPLSSLMNAGSHGSTYGGNPLACAVASAVLQEIREQELAENAMKMGERVLTEVRHWNFPAICGIRGRGLLLGLALDPDHFPKIEGKTPAQQLVYALMDNGLITVPAGPNTVRLLPPLNVSEAEIDLALSILRDTISRM